MPAIKSARKALTTGPVAKKAKQAHKTIQHEVNMAGNSNLLANNIYAALPLDAVDKGETVRTEKLPPFYVKGFPGNTRAEFMALIKQGSIEASIRLCTDDGVKIITHNRTDYNKVGEFLSKNQAEFFSHDIAANKPFKVVLRGLYDMQQEELQVELERLNLKVQGVFKMSRHNKDVKYRDQLYLIHLQKGTTTLPELKAIRALFSVIVQWERYQPVHRDVTQCTNCLSFGHGAKNCHMKSRCSTCGGNHLTKGCIVENQALKCLNCGGEHSTTSRSCPKRAEFINIRKQASTKNQPNRRKTPPTIVEQNFPALPQVSAKTTRLVPNLPPLPLNQRLEAAAAAASPPRIVPGFSQEPRTAPKSASEDNNCDLYSPDQLLTIFTQLSSRLRGCKTRHDQVFALGMFIIEYGS